MGIPCLAQCARILIALNVVLGIIWLIAAGVVLCHETWDGCTYRPYYVSTQMQGGECKQAPSCVKEGRTRCACRDASFHGAFKVCAAFEGDSLMWLGDNDVCATDGESTYRCKFEVTDAGYELLALGLVWVFVVIPFLMYGFYRCCDAEQYALNSSFSQFANNNSAHDYNSHYPHNNVQIRITRIVDGFPRTRGGQGTGGVHRDIEGTPPAAMDLGVRGVVGVVVPSPTFAVNEVARGATLGDAVVVVSKPPST